MSAQNGREDGALVVVSQYIWDGRVETLVNPLQFVAAAWPRVTGRPILVVNLVPWGHLRRWPASLRRFPPGLHRDVRPGTSILNLYGRDWRALSHAGRPLPAGHAASRIRAALRRLGLAETVLVAGDPAHARLFGTCGERACVYYATDDLPAGDPERAASIARDEAEAVARAALVVSVSDALAERDRPRSRAVLLLPNGVDAAELRSLASTDRAVPGWREVPRPRVAYLGHLNRRVDYPALLAAVRALPAVSFVFVGPVDRGDPEAVAAARGLGALPNTLLLGPRLRREVAQVISRCDLGLVPYRVDAFNRSCSPLKVLEYAALGVPAIASPLPSVLSFGRHVRIADLSGLSGAIEEELARATERRSRLPDWVREHTWDARVATLAEALRALDLP